MIEKAYSLFLCVLLISVLVLPLTTAGRVLRDTPQKEDGSGNHGNGGNKIDVHGSPSKPAGSATGQSSPSHATPSRNPANNHVADRSLTRNSAKPATIPCGGQGQAFRDCQRPTACKTYDRDCIRG